MYINRYLEEEVIKISNTFKILYLGGPRQVGKTTLLKRLAEGRKMNYITLDDINNRSLAKNDPKIFLQNNPSPLFIDEVQYAPELFPYLKMAVDESQEVGSYWLSGSQHFTMIKKLQESLAGRIAILSMNTLSRAELLGKQKQKGTIDSRFTKNTTNNSQDVDVFDFVFKGGFPALYVNKIDSHNTYFPSYIQTYLERDLVGTLGVQKILEFNRFMKLCATRTGQILNYSELAKDSDVSVSTAKEWINILVSTMQIVLLQPYSKNIGKRLIKSPKLFFMDTGLCTYLMGWNDKESLKNSAYSGQIFETFVVSEMVKSYLNRGIIPPLYYYRDQQANEVDLIIDRNNKLYPIEIKSSSSIKDKYTKNIKYLQKVVGQIEKGVLCLNSKNSMDYKDWLYIQAVRDIS